MHEVAGGAHVVYVDNDHMVAVHARALLASKHDDSVRVMQADLRDPAMVCGDPEVRRLIDFSLPVCVLFVSVPHGIADGDDPAGIVRA